ncbi:MAG TPA: periplasmic heavy metal sensor [Alphaproteobacteria bacterium]|nr:periplasmic heavy metal sensor [Alphaproteobacteria bacterium]
MSRKLQILLFVSVALNLFFIGSATMHFLGVRWHVAPHGPADILDRLGRHLDSADEASLRDVYQANRSKLDTLFAELQASRYRLRTLLTADPFDHAAFTAALAETHARREAYDRAIEATIDSVVAKLSLDGRRELFASSRHPPPPPPPPGAPPPGGPPH